MLLVNSFPRRRQGTNMRPGRSLVCWARMPLSARLVLASLSSRPQSVRGRKMSKLLSSWRWARTGGCHRVLHGFNRELAGLLPLADTAPKPSAMSTVTNRQRTEPATLFEGPPTDSVAFWKASLCQRKSTEAEPGKHAKHIFTALLVVLQFRMEK